MGEPRVDIHRNMVARLELLLPRDQLHRRSRGSVYRVYLTPQSDTPERDLFEEFLERAEQWIHPHADPHLDEVLGLLDRVVDFGVAGLELRSEGLAVALPEAAGARRRTVALLELQEFSGELQGLPALRLYCKVVFGHLVAFSGAVKTTDQVYLADPELLEAFNDANAVCLALNGLEAQGKLRNRGRAKRLDLDHLGIFSLAPQ